MAKLSVLIPSRQERYLYPTIRDCFAKAAGEIEVVVCLDGYWPNGWSEMTAQFPNLHTVHHGEARGLRPAINSAAASAISRGAKYLFKLDAHCMLDEGFDLKLQADMDDDWIVVPRRKRLDAENWVLQDVGKPDIDYHYLSFPDDPDDWGGPGLNGKPWTQRILDRKDKPEFDIDDEMSSQGSAWACHAEYFTRLGLMDTASYGPFWNEFQECGMCCWLSGGQVKVNKKTWYAHLRKGKEYEGADGKKGRGYTLPESWLTSGRNHTMKWIWNEAWDSRQIRPFSWLIEHFWPVPSWPDNWEEVLYATRKPRGIIAPFRKLKDSDMVRVTPDSGGVELHVHPGVLKIHFAAYGIGGHPTNDIDVTDRVTGLIKDGTLDVIVNNSTLTPGENPFRGKKKRLLMRYSFDDGEAVTIEREEKDWLIIGPPAQVVTKVSEQYEQDIQWQRAQVLRESGLTGEEAALLIASQDANDGREPAKASNAALVAVGKLASSESKRAMNGEVRPLATQYPMTPAALNDYLIRRFSISPQRLRGPMPIELRDFHRNDLAQLFAELGFIYGAEIGVAEGNYSEILMKANPTMKLLLVDPWHHYSANPQGKSKEKHEYAYSETKRKMADYHNVEFLAVPSMTAVPVVDENSLDFCYIDGNHLFDYVMQDLIEWSKRVRSGGIVSGDDYYALDQKRWVGGGVVEAVQAYVNAHRIPVWFLCSGHKSVDYFWVKP